MQKLSFTEQLGPTEVREIRLLVANASTITDATYSVNGPGGVVQASTPATVDGMYVSGTVGPLAAGSYEAVFSFSVGAEKYAVSVTFTVA